MRQKNAKYYFYHKKTGVYYCCPLSKITGKKLYSISTGTKDREEAKKIMDSWANNNAFHKPYERGKPKPISTVDIVKNIMTMTDSKEFILEDISTILWTLIGAYRYEIASDLKGFLAPIFSMLNINIDISKLIKENKQKNNDIKLVDFILKFWDYDNSPYIVDLINMGTLSSELPKKDRFLHTLQAVRKHIVHIDKNILLKDTTSKLINNFFFHLLSKCNVSENYMPTLARMITQPLRYAEEKHLIPEIITTDIRKYKEKEKKKAILTREETHKLFSLIDNFKNLKHYCVNRIALETASRVGEILALTINDIKIINKNECWITRNKSYNPRTHKIGSTKTKENKTVTISPTLLQLLHKLIKENPYKDKMDNPFLFFHSTMKDRPVSYTKVTREFRRVIKELGFQRPSLTFHSYRHLAVLILSDENSSTREIMSITGHKTEKMVSRYANHETEKQRKNKMELVSKITTFLN
ncbi:MAG: tyrosine-type recombinase/integrase [Treponema sp.]